MYLKELFKTALPSLLSLLLTELAHLLAETDFIMTKPGTADRALPDASRALQTATVFLVTLITIFNKCLWPSVTVLPIE